MFYVGALLKYNKIEKIYIKSYKKNGTCVRSDLFSVEEFFVGTNIGKAVGFGIE